MPACKEIGKRCAGLGCSDQAYVGNAVEADSEMCGALVRRVLLGGQFALFSFRSNAIRDDSIEPSGTFGGAWTKSLPQKLGAWLWRPSLPFTRSSSRYERQFHRRTSDSI